MLVSNFTAPDTSSLVVAKPDRIEVWDVGKTGLVWKAELEVWGSIVGIEKVVTKVGSQISGLWYGTVEAD